MSRPGRLNQHIFNYYETLYESVGARNFQPVLDQCSTLVHRDTNDALTAPATLEEVKAATFQLGATKALGPDDLKGQFYQNFWEDIQTNVFSLIRNLFDSGSFDQTLNQIQIVLIPKVANPESISQHRPISLCNYGYKIIFKVMANRLKPWLSSLIAN